MATRSTYVFVHLPSGPVPAGKLVVVEDSRLSYATFTYGARYLERPDRVPVDPEALPLPPPGQTLTIRTDESFTNFNGIRDAAPDGWGQYLMTRAAGKERVMTDFDYLVASGDHRVGALAFGPDPHAAPRRIAPWGDGHAHGERVGLSVLLDAAERVQVSEDAAVAAMGDGIDADLRRLLEAGSSLGGARPKAATERDGRPWIAKFASKEDRYDIVRAEYGAMKLAAECGLDVPPIDAINVYGRGVYLIQRFDRHQASQGRWPRVPFASALTMLKAHDIAAYNYSYRDLADILGRHGSRPKADRLELFRRMAFNILCGNTDDHLRNHAFLYDGRGWRLSPLYDVVPKPQVGSDRNLILGVGAEGRKATLANALTGCGSFGLVKAEAGAALEAMRARVEVRWEAVFRACGVQAGEIPRLSGCFAESRNGNWASD